MMDSSSSHKACIPEPNCSSTKRHRIQVKWASAVYENTPNTGFPTVPLYNRAGNKSGKRDINMMYDEPYSLLRI